MKIIPVTVEDFRSDIAWIDEIIAERKEEIAQYEEEQRHNRIRICGITREIAKLRKSLDRLEVKKEEIRLHNLRKSIEIRRLTARVKLLMRDKARIDTSIFLKEKSGKEGEQ